MMTPETERHTLLPDEREQWTLHTERGVLPASWYPLNGLSQWWWGPGLTVTERRGENYILYEGNAARRHLVEHAFRLPPHVRQRIQAVGPPGIPIRAAISEMQRALPEWRCVDEGPGGAIFVRFPLAVVQCVASHAAFDGAGWLEKGEAIDMLFALGLARPDSTMVASDPPALVEAHALNIPAASDPDDVVSTPIRVPIMAGEGSRLLRGILITLVAFVMGPVVAGPLLFVGPVAWMIGIVALWTVAIPAGRALLRRLDVDDQSPFLEFTGHELRVPQSRGKCVQIDLRSAKLARAWFPSRARMASSGGTRPAFARWQIVADGVELTIVAIELPRPDGFPTEGRDLSASALHVEVRAEDFRKVTTALQPWMSTRAASALRASTDDQNR